MMLLAQEGDNFLFPSPGFPLALTIARSMKLEPRIYNLDPNKLWHADLSQMEKLIDEKTKFVLVNDPSNPLGACWDKKHKLEIMELCRKHKLPILAD
jgi:tyrosine aminotransferase